MTDFIAEIGSNHNGDPYRAQRLVHAAADVGATAVKFQYFRPKTLYARGHWYKVDVRACLPDDWLPRLSAQARTLGLRFGCSVFDVSGLDVVLPYVDFVKVSSYSLLDARLLQAVGQAGRPVMLSTGMATQEEISLALRSLRTNVSDLDLTLLHCVSQYPVKFEDCHLALIKTLSDGFGVPVGWSDHSGDLDVVTRAVLRWRAPVVECHFDLDGFGLESQGGHCWTEDRLAHLISAIARGERADGPALASRMSLDCELAERAWRADPADGLRPMRSVR